MSRYNSLTVSLVGRLVRRVAKIRETDADKITFLHYEIQVKHIKVTVVEREYSGLTHYYFDNPTLTFLYPLRFAE